MRKLIFLLLLPGSVLFAQNPTGDELIKRIDQNMSSKNRIFTSNMIIHGRRSSRTIQSKTWAIGDKKSFTEYLAPAREQGTKMLKDEDKLWIFSPSTDRIIQISGHMLRQSLMGSDLSYEDMMEDNYLVNKYNAVVTAKEEYDNRDCWIVELTAKTADVSYQIIKMWVDTERYIPLKEELYAKGGKLLKRMELSDVVNLQGRWFPKKIVFKDMLKRSDGTEFIITDIKFDQQIPEHIFTKASLK
ncbi:outer membrane lipoprotein-sorting protein [Bacteroidota bacterium]